MESLGLPVLLAGICIGAIAYTVLGIVFSEESRVSRRLKALSAFERSQASEVEPLAKPFSQRVLKPTVWGFVGVARMLAPGDYRARLAKRIRTAGNPGGMGVDTMLVFKLVALGAAATLGGLVVLAAGRGVAAAGLGAAVSAAVGFFLPDAWLSGRVTSRKTQIRRSLPDMLDMLMISVEAGLGFDSALAKFVGNSSGPLAHEFATVLYEIQAGKSRREALRDLADRVDVPELSAFVMAMVQADVFGVSVSNVLRTQSREIRLKRRQHAEEVAQKLPAKMVFPLILLILPATLIVLVGPAVVAIGRAFGMLQ